MICDDLMIGSFLFQCVKLMNFQEEVSAHRGRDGFLAQANILLDEKAASLDEVLRRMLDHVATDGLGSCNADEVMSALFIDAGEQGANGEQRAARTKCLMWSSLEIQKSRAAPFENTLMEDQLSLKTWNGFYSFSLFLCLIKFTF